MPNPELFRLKSTAQLVSQVDSVSNILGESITRPSAYNETLAMSINELKNSFPVRLQVYLDTLRRHRKDELIPVWYTKRMHTFNALDRYISTHYSQMDGERTLLEHQMSAFESLRDFLEKGETAGYIRLPTGAGKTVVFTEFVEATDPKTLIVVPTQILVDQTEERFREFAPTTETGKVYNRHKDYSRQTTLTTYTSFLRDVESEKINPADYDLLILDEAHKSLSLRRIGAVRGFANAIKLGFTATPRYTQEKHLGNLLVTEIHNMSTREAVEQGVLSPLSVYIAKTDVDLSDVKVTSRGDYKNSDLERAINIAGRNVAAVNLYKAMFDGQRAVAYCVSVKHAEALASNFRGQGIVAELVSGYQPRAEQQAVLDRFKSGEIQVICNADILIEGFDDPHVNVCLNLRPTISPVIAEQRAGRVLRPDPANPFKHSYIVDFIDQFTDPDHFPVSYAQIIEAANIFRSYDNPNTHPRFGAEDRGVTRYPEIGISGLKVITEAEEVMRVVIEMIEQRHPLPQKGWHTINAVSSRFRISRDAVQRLIKNYRESNPEYFRMFRPPHGQKAHEYISPEITRIIQEFKANAKVPIEGWMTATEFAKELGVGYPMVEKLLKQQRAADPANIRVFKPNRGQLAEYYSPGVLATIRAQLREEHLDIGTPREGWLTYSQAGRLLKADYKTIETLAEPYKEAHPEFFAKFRINRINNRKGRAREYIAPQLVQAIKERIASIPVAEEGWFSRNKLAKTLEMGDSTLVNLLEQYKKTQPEGFQIRRNSKGQISEYISPVIIAALQTKRQGVAPPEEGWLNYLMLAEELGINHKTAQKIAKRYRESYPDAFKTFRSSNGHLREFVSPNLVAVLKEESGKVGKPEEGWITASGLQDEGISSKYFYYVVEKYRKTNPEYFRVYRDKGGRISEHFSPELVNKVRRYYHPVIEIV